MKSIIGFASGITGVTSPSSATPGVGVAGSRQVERGEQGGRVPNQVAQLADAVLEASCLVAVLAVPLYFSVLTQTGYEPDKAILLRLFAALIAAAWLVGFLAGGRWPGRAWRAQPIVWLACAVFLAYVLATVLSVDPRASLWGSQERQEGLWTRAAYLVVLIAVVTRLWSQSRRERLITALLFGSVVAVAYGFVEQLGYEPVPASGDPSSLAFPVRSTFGQHVFFGSYLVMVIPFTAARLGRAWQARTRFPPGREGLGDVLKAVGIILFSIAVFFLLCSAGMQRPALFALLPGVLGGYVALVLLLDALPLSPLLQRARLAGYALLLALQLATLAFTGARAAWLGFFASVPVFAFLLTRRLNLERVWKGILVITVAGGLFLILLNVPGGPLQPLRSVHALARIANITDTGGAEGSGQGRLLIWQGVKDLMTRDPSVGGRWGGPLRDIVGYGPETLHWTFQAVFPLKLRQVTAEIWTWDRAHDIYLDYLVEAGLLGLLAVAATLVFAFASALRSYSPAPDAAAWLIIAASAALAAHLVDGLFSLETAVSLLLFWILIGFIASPATPEEARDQPSLPYLTRVTGAFWLILGLAAAVLMALTSAADYPALLATIWLAAAVGSVGLAASLLLPAGATQDLRLPALGRPMVIPAGAALLTALVLGSQMRFETAAIAERSGLGHLTSASGASAVQYLQDAARANAYEPQYDTDLASAYLTLAGTHDDSADPLYQPGGDDAKTIDPEHANNLGQAQLLELSRLSLQEALSLAPLNPETYENIGNVYLQAKQPAEALAAYMQAERLSLANPRYLDDQALARLQMGQAHQAQAQASAALRLDDRFWYSYYTLSLAHHQLGARRQARQDAAAALAWAPSVWPPPPDSQIAQLQQMQRQG